MNLTLKTEINSNEVIDIYNQSKVGLILSGNTGETVQGGKKELTIRRVNIFYVDYM